MPRSWVLWSQGVITVELVEFTRLMKNYVWLCRGSTQHRKVVTCWLHGRKTQYSDNGGCPSRPFYLKLHNSVSPCMSLVYPELVWNSLRLKKIKYIFQVWFTNEYPGEFVNKNYKSGLSWLVLKESWTMCRLGKAGSQRVIMVELLEFTRLMENQIWPC